MKTQSHLIASLALIGVSQVAFAADPNYADFSDGSSLKLNGSAQANVTDDAGRKVLRLTPSVDFQAGSAFSLDKISLASDASFSTFFSFRMSVPLDGGADGIVFVVQNVANNVGGAGGGIGYLGIDQSVGVEFDTFDNGAGLGDLNGNHVSIDKNGTFDGLAAGAYASADALGQMDQGDVFYAWVDYNGATDTMEVRLNNAATRPVAPLVTRTGLDLPDILGGAGPDATDAFVGFTAGTGIASDNHDILSWGFRPQLNPFPDANVPDAGPGVLSSLALLGMFGAQRLFRKRA